MTRPLNFGLADAVSRIGGYSTPTLPALLDGVQPVAIYADVSKSLASEVFESRALAAVIGASFVGIELASKAPGGIVIEKIEARFDLTGGVPGLGLNIVKTSSGVNPISKLDIGGVPTDSTVLDLAAALAFGALLPYIPSFITSGGATLYHVQTDVRMWVPGGSFFQAFPVGGGGSNQSIQLTWRELADAQGEP